jgi:hypothetical protein
MKKIIYIFFSKINKNLYEALCINAFEELDIEVELIDLTELFFMQKISQEYKNIKYIDTYKKLEIYIQNNANNQTLFNVQIHYETRFFRLFIFLKKYKCKTSIFEIGYQPQVNRNKRILKYLFNPQKVIKRIFFLLFDKIMLRLRLINLIYDVRFTAGEIARNLVLEKSNKIVQINYIDYEYNVQNKIEIKNNDYFVFLDINLYKHEDEIFSGSKSNQQFKSEIYVNKLNKFFSKIEKQFNISVIIAAHPKSNYKKETFNGRKIIKNDTVSLVQNSKLVISHHSTSISYAVLNLKPIVFIYDDNIKQDFNNVYLTTLAFADYLNMPCLNIDLNENIFIQDVNVEKYENYKYNFLTTRDSELYNNKETIRKVIIQL